MGTPAFEPDRVLAGRYRLERRLGKGGMGTIWRAEHLVLQAPVAVKLIDRDALPDEETIGASCARPKPQPRCAARTSSRSSTTASTRACPSS